MTVYKVYIATCISFLTILCNFKPLLCLFPINCNSDEPRTKLGLTNKLKFKAGNTCNVNALSTMKWKKSCHKEINIFHSTNLMTITEIYLEIIEGKYKYRNIEKWKKMITEKRIVLQNIHKLWNKEYFLTFIIFCTSQTVLSMGHLH